MGFEVRSNRIITNNKPVDTSGFVTFNVYTQDSTITDPVRKVRLNTATSSALFQIWNGTSFQFSARGDNKLAFLTNTFASGYDINIGDASNRKKSLQYLSDTKGAVWNDGSKDRIWFNALNDTSNPLFNLEAASKTNVMSFAQVGGWRYVAGPDDDSAIFADVFSTGNDRVIKIDNGPTNGGRIKLYEAGVLKVSLDARAGETNVFIENTSIGTSANSARFHVKGANTSSASFSGKFLDGSDVNIIKMRNDGYVIQRGMTAAIAGGDLANGEFSLAIDETLNFAVFTVKYSTGVVKTGGVPLI